MTPAPIKVHENEQALYMFIPRALTRVDKERRKDNWEGKSGRCPPSPSPSSSMRVTLNRNGIPLENIGKQIIVANETPYALRRCLWSLPFPDRMCVAIILTEDRNPRTVVVWLIEIDPVWISLPVARPPARGLYIQTWLRNCVISIQRMLYSKL